MEKNFFGELNEKEIIKSDTSDLLIVKDKIYLPENKLVKIHNNSIINAQLLTI